MVAKTLDHRQRARVPHRKAFAGHAAEERFALDRAVERDVAGDDVFSRLAAELGRRLHRYPAARKSLAAVIVGVADDIQPYAAREKSTEALPRGAGQAHVDGF